MEARALQNLRSALNVTHSELKNVNEGAEKYADSPKLLSNLRSKLTENIDLMSRSVQQIQRWSAGRQVHQLSDPSHMGEFIDVAKQIQKELKELEASLPEGDSRLQLVQGEANKLFGEKRKKRLKNSLAVILSLQLGQKVDKKEDSPGA